MNLSNTSNSTSFNPASITDVIKENSKSLTSQARYSQAIQVSTIVELSLQGQLLNQSDKPGSMSEGSEARAKESTESARLQFMEGETKSNANTFNRSGSAQTAKGTTSTAISTYQKVAAN